MARARHRAGVVARHAGPAHLRPHRIDRAGGRNPDLARKGGAALAVAAHAAAASIDWRVSSWCAAGDCVAVGRLPDGQVLLKDTKDPDGPQLRFDEPGTQRGIMRDADLTDDDL